jgi:hypothetical protein
VVQVGLVSVPYFLTVRHRLLAQSMMASVRSRHHIDRIAIVNAARSLDDRTWLLQECDVVEDNDANILARAWNRGIRLALDRGADYVIVSNLDIQFHPLCIDNLVECAIKEPRALVWCPASWSNPRTFMAARLQPATQPGVHWGCFMVDRRFLEVVGEFDETFVPAYLEDADMAYRLHLAGAFGVNCLAALYLNYDRGTIKGIIDCDGSDVMMFRRLLTDLRAQISANDERYLQKWGGRPGEEQLSIPYNGAQHHAVGVGDPQSPEKRAH